MMQEYTATQEQIAEIQQAYAIKVYDGKNLPCYFINSPLVFERLNTALQTFGSVKYEVLDPKQIEELMT